MISSPASLCVFRCRADHWDGHLESKRAKDTLPRGWNPTITIKHPPIIVSYPVIEQWSIWNSGDLGTQTYTHSIWSTKWFICCRVVGSWSIGPTISTPDTNIRGQIHPEHSRVILWEVDLRVIFIYINTPIWGATIINVWWKLIGVHLQPIKGIYVQSTQKLSQVHKQDKWYKQIWW